MENYLILWLNYFMLDFKFCLDRRANEVLALETQMFEKYLKRAEPRELEIGLHPPIREKQAFGSNATLSSHSDQGTSSRLARKRSKSRGSALEKSLRLNPEQKCDIAQRELEEYQHEVKKSNEESEKNLDTLRVSHVAKNKKTSLLCSFSVLSYISKRLKANIVKIVCFTAHDT